MKDNPLKWLVRFPLFLVVMWVSPVFVILVWSGSGVRFWEAVCEVWGLAVEVLRGSDVLRLSVED
jgi:hypothetical protein